MLFVSQRVTSMSARRGFTLVEMLVSTALIAFIMVILSQAFVTAVTAYRELKAVGDMQEKLRTVGVILRRDLGKDHFVSATAARRKLSTFTTNPMAGVMWTPPAAGEGGCFRIWQGST